MCKMTNVSAPWCLLAAALISSVAAGQEYSAEAIASAPAAEGASEEILQRIADQGVRVQRGSRTVCEIWFCKQLPIDSGFEPSETQLYPFQPGQLIGMLYFPRRGAEFRDQAISSGWYTLRFGLQPVDGNHVGTSPTRDFLLLVDVDQDELADNWKDEDLNTASAEAAGSSHPAMLCLQRPAEGGQLSLRHDEANDWWILHTAVQGMVGDQLQEIPLDLVVAGHAAE
jgi:hypothetical protein